MSGYPCYVTAAGIPFWYVKVVPDLFGLQVLPLIFNMDIAVNSIMVYDRSQGYG